MIDLDQLAVAGSRGRRPEVFDILFVRELDEGDMGEILSPTVAPNRGHELKRIRETHHAMARLVAEGRQNVEVASIMGLSPQTIYILKQDPSFKELVEYYKAQTVAAYQNVHERLARVGTVAMEIVEERLLEAPESFSHRELLAVAETTLDRSIAPPKGREAGQQAPTAPIAVQINFVPHQKVEEVKVLEDNRDDT